MQKICSFKSGNQNEEDKGLKHIKKSSKHDLVNNGIHE